MADTTFTSGDFVVKYGNEEHNVHHIPSNVKIDVIGDDEVSILVGEERVAGLRRIGSDILIMRTGWERDFKYSITTSTKKRYEIDLSHGLFLENAQGVLFTLRIGRVILLNINKYGNIMFPISPECCFCVYGSEIVHFDKR